MRLVTYEKAGAWWSGVVIEDQLVDTARALGNGEPADPAGVNRRLLGEAGALERLQQAAQELAGRGDAQPLADARLGPPVPDPEKFICLGLNYRDHAAEAKMDAPPAPILFSKFRNSLVGPHDPIVLPAAAKERVDYEAELGVVIGPRTKDVSEDEALSRVAGYTVVNDVSARDLQMQTTQWLAGKALDTFAPCGPALVTADEIPDPQRLQLRTRVNDEVLQDASTAEMIFSVAETIAFLSRLMTLEPGDLIATGTPAGVGFARKPPVYLKDGDIVEIEIDGLGALRNPVVD
jgi:2-keto-4-pentenoate hydratase/2-oxohepta-3-ene-1,7-dioic acid hydratase in catechol pathway